MSTPARRKISGTRDLKMFVWVIARKCIENNGMAFRMNFALEAKKVPMDLPHHRCREPVRGQRERTYHRLQLRGEGGRSPFKRGGVGYALSRDPPG